MIRTYTRIKHRSTLLIPDLGIVEEPPVWILLLQQLPTTSVGLLGGTLHSRMKCHPWPEGGSSLQKLQCWLVYHWIPEILVLNTTV